MFFYLLFFIAVFFGWASPAYAHGGIWMGQYPNWLDGVQWGAVIGFAALIAFSYFVLRAALQKLQNVDLAGHLAHNLNHFLGEGKTILAAISGIFSGEMKQIIFQWFLNYGTVRMMQYIVLGLGVIGTFIITYRIAKKTAATKWELAKVMAPHLFLLAALMAFNFYIFSLPMVHRSQNIF